jgi:hypothetical protein
MFKAPQAICKKLDSIINAFWWGYDPDKKKLHLTNWDTLTTPKNLGELGIKKFGLMNKALITKQYWRIFNNPDSFLAKTLKSKYCPQEDVHTHIPKKTLLLDLENYHGQRQPNSIYWGLESWKRAQYTDKPPLLVPYQS